MRSILHFRMVYLAVLCVLCVTSGLHAGNPLSGDQCATTSDTIKFNSWSLLIEATIQSLHDSLATLGVRPNATPDFDPAYDAPRPPNPPGDYLEVYFPHTGGNWPTLLGTKFADDITGPQNPSWTIDVECTLSSGLLQLTWDTVGINHLPKEYHIWMYDSTAGVTINLRKSNSYGFQYDGVRTFSVWIEFNVQMFDVTTGWNMVSLPCNANDSTKANLFPTAISNAFAFNGTYVVENILKPGIGYWLKFSEGQTLTVGGIGLNSVTAHLVAGWNMIGTPSKVIRPPRSGILLSDYFEYTGAYRSADSLRPGKAYWVKASDTGSIALSGSISLEKEGPGTDFHRCTKLTISDRGSGIQDLYLADRATVMDIQGFELPPLPPEGIFDARFASQRYLETYNPASKGEFAILVQTAHPPLTISAERIDPRFQYMVLTSGSAGQRTARILDEHSPVVIEYTSGQTLKVVVAPRGRVPDGYRFEQNYPNPFNPSTAISYYLPERSELSMELLDVLGRPVSSLVSGVQEPGDHSLNIDAQELHLASGTYYCRIQATGTMTATNYRETIKLIYLK